MSNAKVSLEVFSDIACPWCFIGLRNLERALTQLPPGTVELTFRAYELSPDLPREGAEVESYFTKKFGSMERIRMMQGRVADAGKGAGIDFQFEKQTRIANTRLLHRLVKLSAETAQGALAKETLFRANFEEGLDLSKQDVALERLEKAGIATAGFAEKLDAGAYTDDVISDEKLAQELGITGVPTFVADRKMGVSGAQPAEVLVEMIRKAAEG